MIKKVTMYASGPPAFKRDEMKQFVGALASACVTEEGGTIAAGNMLCNKPKSRGSLAMDNKRLSMCVGVIIPCPVLSHGDRMVKAVVVAFEVRPSDTHARLSILADVLSCSLCACKPRLTYLIACIPCLILSSRVKTVTKKCGMTTCHLRT